MFDIEPPGYVPSLDGVRGGRISVLEGLLKPRPFQHAGVSPMAASQEDQED